MHVYAIFPHSCVETSPDAAKEIPRSQLTFHEDENYFLVQVSEDAQKALGKLAGATVNASNPSSAVFTLYSFPPTKGGRDAICSYMEVLKSMCEKVDGKPLKTRNWTELKLRVPAYFANLYSYEKFSQKMTHDQQSAAVWRKFRDIAPSKKNGSKAFLRFLQAVDQEAPKALPIDVE